MIYATLKTLHLLAVLLWVGGMAFAHLFLRPALGVLAGPQRLALMHEVLRRFLAAVSVASVLAVATGIWMLGRVAKQAVQSGGSFAMPPSWMVMAALGTVMLAIFGYIRFVLFNRFGHAMAAQDNATAAAELAQVRRWVAVNLVLGVVVTVVAVARLPG